MPLRNAEEAARYEERLITLVEQMNWVEATRDWKSYWEAQVRRLLRTERRYADPNEPQWLREARHELIAGYGQLAYAAGQEIREFQKSRNVPPRSDRFQIAAELEYKKFLLRLACNGILRSKHDYEKWFTEFIAGSKRNSRLGPGDKELKDLGRRACHAND